ncbi:MAG: mevalonate kinase family protein [Candidatus Helarchaeota archaeon]
MSGEKINVRAPGRICLFGEHQDYLRLPVISAAISLYIRIQAKKTNEKKITIDFLDLNRQDVIHLKNREVEYQYTRDYLRSAYNLFIRSGYRLGQGYHVTIQGELPMNAGLGSSSTLVIAWVTFLNHIFNASLNAEQIAEIAHQAEVDEFREVGGKMDHYTSALGGLLYLTMIPPFKYERLNIPLTGLILGDSLEKKDTVKDLMKVRELIQLGISRIRKYYEGFDLGASQLEEVSSALLQLPQNIREVIKANLINRDLTQQARQLLTKPNFIPKKFGNLLDLHHQQLAKGLKISTTKIEKLITAAKDAGAMGCKINGSGFGGCMIAYAPDQEGKVADAIERAGGKAYQVSLSDNCQLTIKR